MVLPCLLYCPSALGFLPAKVLLSSRSSFSCASMIIPALHSRAKGDYHVINCGSRVVDNLYWVSGYKCAELHCYPSPGVHIRISCTLPAVLSTLAQNGHFSPLP